MSSGKTPISPPTWNSTRTVRTIKNIDSELRVGGPSSHGFGEHIEDTVNRSLTPVPNATYHSISSPFTDTLPLILEGFTVTRRGTD
ncbi:MAG: hypothetical protein U0528_02660 [Anaerolineae bacterium]